MAPAATRRFSEGVSKWIPCPAKNQILHLCTGKMPAIAALAYHRASGRDASGPNQRLGYSENFLYMLDAANKPGYRCGIVRFGTACTLPSSNALH